MGKLNVFITSANGNLAGQKDSIKNAASQAEDFVFSKLKIDWDIDLVITNHMPFMLIPEDGVGGRTYWCDLINMCVDEENYSESKLSEMIAHELCHAARWGKNDEYMNTLFDGIINEGIATYFEATFAKGRKEKQFFIETILARSDEENEKILNVLKDKLDDTCYDYDTIFFSGDESLPRWSGYSLGYYLVKKYLNHTNKTIEEAFADKYSDFKVVL